MSNTLFSTKRAINENTSNNVPFMPAGIHEDILLKKVEIDQTAHGVPYIRFEYTNKEGLELKNSEFEPSKRPYEDDAQFTKRVGTQVRRMVNNYIVPYYGYEDGVKIPESEQEEKLPQFEGGGFFALITWIKSQIDDKMATTPLRIKAVYDNKNWIGLPNYNKYVSVEPMSTKSREITKLSIDNFEPQEIDDETKSVGVSTDPFATKDVVKEGIASSPTISEAAMPVLSANPF